MAEDSVVSATILTVGTVRLVYNIYRTEKIILAVGVNLLGRLRAGVSEQEISVLLHFSLKYFSLLES